MFAISTTDEFLVETSTSLRRLTRQKSTASHVLSDEYDVVVASAADNDNILIDTGAARYYNYNCSCSCSYDDSYTFCIDICTCRTDSGSGIACTGDTSGR